MPHAKCCSARATQGSLSSARRARMRASSGAAPPVTAHARGPTRPHPNPARESAPTLSQRRNGESIARAPPIRTNPAIGAGSHARALPTGTRPYTTAFVRTPGRPLQPCLAPKPTDLQPYPKPATAPLPARRAPLSSAGLDCAARHGRSPESGCLRDTVHAARTSPAIGLAHARRPLAGRLLGCFGIPSGASSWAG